MRWPERPASPTDAGGFAGAASGLVPASRPPTCKETAPGAQLAGHADLGAQLQHQQHGARHDDALPQQRGLEAPSEPGGGDTAVRGAARPRPGLDPAGGGEPLRIMRASRGAGQGRWCPSLRPEPQMRRAALPVPTHRRPQRAQGPPPQASSLLQSTATTPKAVRMVLVIPKNWSPCRLVDHRGQLTRVVKRGDSEGSARLGGWRCLPSGQPHTRHPTPRLTPGYEAEDVLFGPLCEK